MVRNRAALHFAFLTDGSCEKFSQTFACMHLLAGVDVRTVQWWLGHSDLETTSCYLKAISGKQKGVREKVDATFRRHPRHANEKPLG